MQQTQAVNCGVGQRVSLLHGTWKWSGARPECRQHAQAGVCRRERAMAENLVVPETLQVDQVAHAGAPSVPAWTRTYLRQVVIADAGCGLAAGLLAFEVRFGANSNGAVAYFWLALSLPVLWLATLMLAGAYGAR